jgi:hypothetical protein
MLWAATRADEVRAKLMTNRPAATQAKRPRCDGGDMLWASSLCTARLNKVQMARARALAPKAPATGRHAMKRKR